MHCVKSGRGRQHYESDTPANMAAFNRALSRWTLRKEPDAHPCDCAPCSGASE